MDQSVRQPGKGAGLINLVALGLFIALQWSPTLAAQPSPRNDLPWWMTRFLDQKRLVQKYSPAVVFIGDSITAGWSRSNDLPSLNIRPVWNCFYQHRKSANLGIPGDATDNVLWRLRNGAIDGAQPKLIVLLIGLNDLARLRRSPETTAKNIAELVGVVKRQRPFAQVIVIKLLPNGHSPALSQKIEATNRSLSVASYPQGVTLLDMSDNFLDNGTLNRSLFYDQALDPKKAPIHPNAAGHTLMAKSLEPLVCRVLADCGSTQNCDPDR